MGKGTELLVFQALVVALTGCAEIGLKPPNHRDEPIRTRAEERPLEGDVAPQLAGSVVTTLRVCETYQVKEIRRTSTSERHNKQNGRTWTFAIAGVAATGAGIGMMVDSGNVHPKDETSRTYNPTGKGAALGYGAAITAGGVALTTLAIVDAVRASGYETNSSTVTDDGDPLSKGPCLGVPAPGVEVYVSRQGTADADKVLAGATDASGLYNLDLNDALPGDFSWGSKTIDVWVQGRVIGQVDATSVFEQRESAGWAALDKDKCEEPKHSSDCSKIEAFLKQYPDGVNHVDAETLLKGSEEKLEALQDDEAWAEIPADAKTACIDHSTNPRNFADTACSPFLGYQESYPNGRHAKEAEGILVKAEKAAAKREADADKEARKREAAAEAERRREEKAERDRCRFACMHQCSNSLREGSCLLGCMNSRCGGGFE